jgi:zinc D-Ala-D-Ala dipeptidase
MRALVFTLCLIFAPAALARPAGFVDAATVVPGLAVEMAYIGSENFIGRPVDGYEAPVCILTQEAAMALAAAQSQLAPFGLGLKVFDCYRPKTAVAHFVRWARDLKDEARKADFYPNVDKRDLFKLGYIAERSGHSRGSTVDLSIIDRASGAELDMGGRFDLFDTLSWPSDPRPSPAQRANRALLAQVMAANGFRGLHEEWWHFTLRREPFPKTFFDFPVRAQ